MKMFKLPKYMDFRSAGKQAIEDANVKVRLSSIVPYLKKKSEDLVKECGVMREKLKDIPGTNYDLGLFHLHAGNIDDAILRFRMVTFLRPENAAAHYNLGRCFFLSDDNEDSKKSLQKAIDLGFSRTEIDYALQKIDSLDQVKAMPISIIKEKAEIVSENYTSYYMSDEYIGYKTFVKTIMANVKDKNPNLDVLDLACRHGSCGQLLKERGVTRKITGVDFISSYLQEAKGLRFEGESTYDELKEKWLGGFLQENHTKFDLILSAHDFEYIGDLKNIVVSLNFALNSRGIFALMLEDGGLESGYKLDGVADKFYYSQSYVKEVFEKSGFSELQIKNLAASESEYESDKYLIYIFEKK